MENVSDTVICIDGGCRHSEGRETRVFVLNVFFWQTNQFVECCWRVYNQCLVASGNWVALEIWLKLDHGRET